MTEAQKLVNSIVNGLQEKKGHDIAIVDLTKIITAPSKYFVICTGGSPQQVEALTDSVAETTRKELHEKPAAIAGLENAEWVAMDYGTVMVHVFLPDVREYYDLEHLWDDADFNILANDY